MAMSEGVRMSSIVIGCSLLVLTLISVICGSVAMTKLTKPAAVSLGLWGLYFPIPAVISILAGYKKNQTLLAVALGTHVVGIILGVVGVTVGATYWLAVQESNCEVRYDYFGYNYYPDYYDRHYRRQEPGSDHCYCFDSLAYKRESYRITCSDLKTVRECTSAVTIIFAIAALISVVGSTFGCIGTCCACRQQTQEQTAQQPNVLVMAPQAYPATYPGVHPAAYPNPTYPNPAYPPDNSQQPSAYGQPSGQVEMPVVDSKT